MENNILLKKYNFELECALRDYKKIDKKIDYLEKKRKQIWTKFE